jgi:chaperonin GroEL
LRLEVPDEQKFGTAIIRRAIEEPLRQIVQNAGEEGSIALARKTRATLGRS